MKISITLVQMKKFCINNRTVMYVHVPENVNNYTNYLSKVTCSSGHLCFTCVTTQCHMTLMPRSGDFRKTRFIMAYLSLYTYSFQNHRLLCFTYSYCYSHTCKKHEIAHVVMLEIPYSYSNNNKNYHIRIQLIQWELKCKWQNSVA